MAVHRAKKKAEDTPKAQERQGVSNDAMLELARVMNDSPSIKTLQGTQWEIGGMKMGTMWLISEEAAKMEYREGLAYGDALKEFASNLDSVIFVMTCALLNDKGRIFPTPNDGETFTYGGRRYSKEFGEVFETLKWSEADPQEWLGIFVEIMSQLQTDFFFESTRLIKTVRSLVLQRKETREETAR